MSLSTKKGKNLASLLGSIGILLLTVLLVPVQCEAQTLYGSIVGNVIDQTGAAIPGADVTVINQQTNFTRYGITSDVGAYSFPTVPTGNFTVKVGMPGFKEYVETDVPVTVNNVTRVDVILEIGEVTERVTVRAETALLQADRAEVRAELTQERLENLPVPLGRNYQDLFVTLPGFTPPAAVHSIQTNPSRSRMFSVNGVSASINNTRIDGVTTVYPQLPHITGYVPSLEAIETVNVVTGSFDAEQGLAGGAVITVQLKSGANDFNGSAFFFHHDNALRAKRFLYPYPENLRKGKFIFNQWGATFGGPIQQNKLFFFAAYEGTANSRFASRIGSVPTPDVKRGDLSALGRTIYDPLTGNPEGTDRVPFPANVIPEDRISPIARRIIDMIPDPNIEGRLDKQSKNYFGTGAFTWDKWTFDSKVDWIASDTLNMFWRLSTLTYNVEQPTLFGNDKLIGRALSSFGAGGGNPGTGEGTSWNFAYGANYVLSPNFVIDGNFGFAKFFTDSRNPQLDTNVGLDVLGIPGTNGSEWWQGGWPLFDLQGYDDYGTVDTFMPYERNDKNWQYTLNFNWTKGRHEIRWGLDLNRQDMNHFQPEGGVSQGARGRFRFSRDLTRLCTKPDGKGGCKKLSKPTSRQSFGAFLLGMPNRVGKNFLTLTPFTTRNWLRGFYIRDRWQVTPKFTLTYGTRWEHYPVPTRCCGRGFERYDPLTNKMLIGGIGDVPRDLGVSVSKKLFAPRLGIAYRISDDFVIRAGYGMTIDPFPLARDLRTNYPVFIENDLQAPFSWQTVGTLAGGIPEIVLPDLGNGIIDIPADVFAKTIPAKFRRGYVQSWNLTLQKNLIWGLTGEVGYVATRSIRQLGRGELNYADIGTGNKGRQLFKQFGRTASTRITLDAGHNFYDALQTRLQRRFADGFSLDVSYVWSKTMANAFWGGSSDGSIRINIPEFFHLNRRVAGNDLTHNFELMNIWELPLGTGKKWLSDGGFLSKLVGGWQVNNIVSWLSGRPFDVRAPSDTLNAPGNRQRPDLVGPIRKLGGVGPGQPFYDPSAFAEPDVGRFGTAAYGILRRPRVFQWDFGVFRHFRLTEDVNLEFRAEFFNFTNHPLLDRPNRNVDDDEFLEIDSGSRERVIRFGLRLTF